jgi:hypothetical protein
MEELVTGMVLLERSSSTKLRIGISFGSVILTNRDAVVVAWNCTILDRRVCRRRIFLLKYSYFDYCWPATLLDLTVDNVAGPPLQAHFDFRGF